MSTQDNRPPPDFYRIVRVSNGRRLYRGSPGHWFDPKTGDADKIESFPSRAEAEAQMKNAWQGRIVPVRIIIRKLHGFGWALKRMREGKAVRRACWAKGSYVFSSPEGLGGCIGGVRAESDPSTLTWWSVNALDWELSDAVPRFENITFDTATAIARADEGKKVARKSWEDRSRHMYRLGTLQSYWVASREASPRAYVPEVEAKDAHDWVLWSYP